MGWMKKAGIGKIFPSPVETGSRNVMSTSSMSGWTSKAKMVLKKVGLNGSSWSSVSAKISGKDSMFSFGTTFGRDSVDPGLKMGDPVGDDSREDSGSRRSFLRVSAFGWLERRARNGQNEKDNDIEAGLPSKGGIEKTDH